METKKCTVCGIEKTMDQFYRRPSGIYSSSCKICHCEKCRSYRELNPDKIKNTNKRCYQSKRTERIQKQKEYAAANSERIKEYQKKHRSKDPLYSRKQSLARYGLSVDDFKKMLEKQENKCDICEKEFVKQSDAKLDHCHNTNIPRSLLCSHCNTAIGLVYENKKTLSNMILYLEKWKKR